MIQGITFSTTSSIFYIHLKIIVVNVLQFKINIYFCLFKNQ